MYLHETLFRDFFAFRGEFYFPNLRWHHCQHTGQLANPRMFTIVRKQSEAATPAAKNNIQAKIPFKCEETFGSKENEI